MEGGAAGAPCETWDNLRSITQKLLLAIALPAVAIASLGLFVYWRQAHEAIDAATDEETSSLAEFFYNTYAAADPHVQSPTRDGELAHQLAVEAIRSDWDVFRYVSELRVVDRKGVIRYSRRPGEIGRPHPEAERLLAAGPALVRLENRSEVVRPLGGVACASCHPSETAMKLGVLQLVVDEPKIQGEVARVFKSALSSLLLFGAILAGVALVALQLLVSRPLRRLTGLMGRAEKGDFLVRADARGRDELADLARSFNHMLARITSMMAKEIDTKRDLAEAKEELGLKKALEVANARLQKSLADLSLAFDVARSLTSTLELTELLSRISKLVSEGLKIPKFSIMLVGPDGKLHLKVSQPPEMGCQPFDLGEGACGRAASTRKSVYVPDLSTPGSVFVARPGQPKPSGSLLCVPMIHKEVVLGVLNLEHPEAGAFGTEEIDLLMAVADQAALAAKNALLHEETVALSITDPLTGAPNRRHLFQRLEMEINRANRFGTQLSILMVDIDHFKQLNDAAGHRAGDEVLREVCRIMGSMTRKVDLLGRYGGEEFLIVLPQVTKSEAQDVAEKLRRTVEETVFPHGRTQPLGKITISVGVGNLPSDASELDHLVDCADSALYACKRAGRNKAISYAPGMEQHPGRERGPYAARRKTGDEIPVTVVK